MKKVIFFLIAALIFSTQKVQSQTVINFPVNGAIFQQNSNNKHILKFGGQVKHNDNKWYFRIRKRTSDNTWSDIGIDQREISFISSTVDGTRYFFVNQSGGGNIELEKGFYSIILFRKNGLGKKFFYGSAEFGVGDVFYVAGQSNAAGYGGKSNNAFSGHGGLTDIWNSDNTLSAMSNTTHESPMTRVLSSRIDENNKFHTQWNGQQKPISIGSVYRNFQYNVSPRIESTPSGFIQFKNGLNNFDANSDFTDDNRVPIYPNGYNSWIWGPLGYYFAVNGQWTSGDKFSGTPTLWFNAASSGTSMVDLPGANHNSWSRNPADSTSVYAKLGLTLRNFGSVYGAKAVLWTQGEADTQNIWNGDATTDNTIINNYALRLNEIITYSRQAATGLTSGDGLKNLNWFISKTSLIPHPGGSNSTNFLEPVMINSSTSGFISETLRAKQMSLVNNSNNIFEGPDTDNVKKRASSANVHITSDAYEQSHYGLSAAWYLKIKDKSTASVTPAEPLGLTSISKSGSNYTLTVNNTIGATHFFWQKNNEANMRYPHIGSVLPNETTSNTSPSISGLPGDVLHCYAYKNGRFHPVVPFIVPGTSTPLKILSANQSILNYPSSGGNQQVKVIHENVSWQVDSKPSWLSEFYNEDNSTLTYTAPSYSGSRSGTIVLKDEESSLSYTITVNQGTGCSGSTALTSLTPTNSSSEWSGYGSAKFNGKSVDNNTMQVSGVQYSQGIGTHTNSRIVYNLGGAYTTFTGLVGRDDEADNNWDGGKVVFSIKTDGSTVWTSTVHGNTSGAQSFSIPVSGKNTLELIVDKYTDENYSDHANWMNVNLTCSGGCTNAAPTGVSASPSSFSSGGGTSNLTATCAAGTTVVWNGSVGSGSPKTVTTTSTTTYTAKCVSTSCSDSPTVSVTVNVDSTPPATGCSAITNNLVMGYWNITGHELVVKQFHGQWWLVQRISTSPETFLVRGSNMLTRGDVYLHNSTYAGLTGCFGWRDSDFGGLEVPSSGDFATPSGYTLAYEPDGTPYYTASGTPPIGCTNAYLTNSWTYASAAGGTSTQPVIGIAISGGNMAMGSTNYSSSYPGTGIGTHATSEIIYDLGVTHTYQYFKSTVGKDNGSNCGGHDRLKFKVLNGGSGAVLGESPIVGNPDFGLSRTADLSIPISGVRYLKLVVEDGGDGISCDHANWARARLTCTSSGRVSARDSLAPLFTIYPNISNGEFTVEVDLDTDSDFKVDLINSSGAVYKQESHSGKKGQNPVQFKAGNVKSGLYLLRVTTRDRLETKTVVIEK